MPAYCTTSNPPPSPKKPQPLSLEPQPQPAPTLPVKDEKKPDLPKVSNGGGFL